MPDFRLGAEEVRYKAVRIILNLSGRRTVCGHDSEKLNDFSTDGAIF